jgi:uncharacterized membrane protein YqiK
MTDELTEEVPADTEETDEETQEQAVPSDAELRKWKALARKHEQQAKTNAEAAARLKELEDAGKSESEKLQTRLEELEREKRLATIKSLKLEIAQEKGLPPSLAKFLPDIENEVDMMQAADELLEASGSGAKPASRPKSNLTNPLGDDGEAAAQERLLAAMTGRPLN